MKTYKFDLSVDLTPKDFWALLPAVNINIKSKSLEFEWLFIGVYLTKKQIVEEPKYIDKSIAVKNKYDLPEHVEKYLREQVYGNKKR